MTLSWRTGLSLRLIAGICEVSIGGRSCRNLLLPRLKGILMDISRVGRRSTDSFMKIAVLVATSVIQLSLILAGVALPTSLRREDLVFLMMPVRWRPLTGTSTVIWISGSLIEPLQEFAFSKIITAEIIIISLCV